MRALLRSWRPAESVLLIPLPQLDSAVGDLRSRHDPSAAAGVPPHITLVYPFLPPGRLRAAELRALQEVFAERTPLTFDLVGVCGFPGVVYLAPDPAEPLVELVKAVWARFPEAPPYGGVFPQIVPHLTVAISAPDSDLDPVVAAAAAALPIRCVAEEAWLMVRRARWQLSARFRLGIAPGKARVAALAGAEWT
ncbi:MAG TPA: 2'-5' RNA ligase family protein [Candidatus Dormibacteraeota bacterium]